MKIKKTYPYILIVASIIGLLASFVLTIDTIELIKDPNIDLPCNINPFVSCKSVATTRQSEVFGFPNTLLGIVSFSMLLSAGILLLLQKPKYDEVSKTKGEKVFWLLVNLGLLAAFVFVMWFFYQSVYSIGSLCIYCMTVWAVTWPTFLYTTIWNLEENNFSLITTTHIQKRVRDFFEDYHLHILVLWYLLIILLILFHFKDSFIY